MKRHDLELGFGGEDKIYAWSEEWHGEEYLSVQWRRNNKPSHQPFRVPVALAEAVFLALAAFARGLDGGGCKRSGGEGEGV